MTTMNISLPEEQRSFIDAQVSGGDYTSSSEYVRELLRKEKDRVRLRKLIMDGMESELIEAICRNAGIPGWCGGMLESGIGRAHNIAISTLAGYTMPGDVSASKRYWH